MKYSKEERLDIGAKIYHNEITKYEAAERYGISVYSAREYMRIYRDAHGLTEKNRTQEFQQVRMAVDTSFRSRIRIRVKKFQRK